METKPLRRLLIKYFAGPHGRCLIVTLLGCVFMTGSASATDVVESNKDAEAIAELTRPQSSIEIGAGYLSEGSFSAGNYTGLNRQGGYAIGNIDLRGSQYAFANDSDDRTRWRLTGSNLGLSSRSLLGEYGRQGAYRITFGYEQIPRLFSDSYQTPFLGAGSANLSLPTNFVRAATTTNMTSLGADLQSFGVATTRKRSEIGVSYWLTREWELRASLRRDDRDGTKIRGAEFGSNGGNPRSVLLPEPIDTSTQLIDLSLAFSGDNHRITLSYHGSLFKNNIDSLIWQNPYSNTPWVGGASGLPANFPLAMGQTSVAPDNQFHQLALSGSYDFSSSTRLTATATRGRMTQNETFLPYTINPGLTTTGLPRNSLDGVVDSTFLSARLSMRPLRGLAVNASLRYEDRDNHTPQSEYIYVGGDIQLQPPAGSNSDRIRTNLPRSRRHEQATLDADYRLTSTTAIKAGWDLDVVKRTFTEVERATENTYRLELRQGSMGPLTATASVALLARRGTQYLYNLPYLASYTSPAFINGLTAANGCTLPIECVRVGPLQNKFFLADRDRERVRLMIGYLPNASISVQTRVDVNHDRYPHSTYGVNNARNWSAGVDLGYVFNDDFNATLFYNFEGQRSRERSRQIVSLNPAVLTNADSDWTNQLIDKTSSVGFSFRYKGLLGGRLAIDADAIVVRGYTPISTTIGAGVPLAQNPATPFPDLIAHSENINLNARYALDRQSSVRVNYSYRHLNSADWAYEQVGISTLANVISTNEIPPRFAVHGVGVSFIRTFR